MCFSMSQTVPPELQERVAIIMEACGYTEEHALALAMPKVPDLNLTQQQRERDADRR